MKKSIIMVFAFCTCLLVAQDIEGTYRATGQRVEYQYYTRPNTHLDSGNADGSTSLVITDAYGLGVAQEISNIPAGYNFGSRVVGPIGLPEMDAMLYNLYVTFNADGSGSIDDSQVLAGETVDCETEIVLLPLDDDLSYSSDLNAGLTVQSNMVTGQPNVSPYAGQTAGSWSISGSSFFSFFPPAPTPVTHTTEFGAYMLYGAEFAGCYGTCVATGADGMFTPGSAEAHEYCGGVVCAGFLHGYPGMPHPGATAGYIIDSPASSFAPSNMYYGIVPDYHVEWHYIDGPVAETGLGDVVGEDEDGNGDDYDNILGYPNVTSTFMSPACGFNYPILGDVTAIFEGMGMGACVDYSAGGADGYAAGTAGANSFYLMDAQFGPWGNFLTWNAVMYLNTGDTSFLADDSSADLDPTQIVYIDVTDGSLCDPSDGSPYCVPYNANGGRLVMNFSPTCIPVITAISVLGELTDVGCASEGDVNSDGSLDVLDVVAVVGYILGNSDAIDCADLNNDGNVDVLDVVAMVSTILGGRGEEASSATFTKTDDLMAMTADGVVGAVLMTLSHGSDFSLELTKDAFVADYNTDGGTTKLMVVNPEGEIFTSTGDYTVEEVVAATTEGYINTNWDGPVSISLGKAYPNPFNPSTSFDLNVGQAGHVSVMVYNVSGQLVDAIHEGNMDKGTYNMTWNGENVASGMYIIKANSADVTTSQKVMLIK
jgi:hypothetical protein